MEYFYLTDSGKVRDHNEDSVIVVQNNSNEYLLIVADGMGGHRAGEIASSIAITHLGKRFKELGSIGSKEEAINWLKDTVSEANILICKYASENPSSLGMGTTLVLCLKTADYLLFGNIGDSSGFVFKDKRLHKITVDHTLVNLLVSSGELTEEEAQDHPKKNVLMRALGATNTVEMDIFDVEVDVDGVLLCSDGLTNMLNDEQIGRVLNEKLSLEDKLKKLILKSNNRGGNDNISIACFLKEGED
ncbi:MAG: Stp1/IreP family PP2C-type Ser/Thr phosphatase [Bacilli bacterium]|nr:Stp1/IreP family PP2C-type Ser/Thr phosphatase [Bacilli bacterium]MDD4719030.1 Stp1/IreP family PP2C-type Ser/Thr phosphatase [Bacilli bacterium]